MSKIKLTFTLPTAMQQQMRQKIVGDNYSLRAKSKWIVEAIIQLFEIDNYIDLVSYNDEMAHLSKNETISIPEDIKALLEQKVVEVKQKYIMMEGVQSRIIRTAIMQRILRT